MKTSQLNLRTSSRVLLMQLVVAHLIGSIFAYTVYINLSSLGDGYAPGDFGGFDEGLNRTILVHGIYAYLNSFFPGFLAPLALGVVVAITTWHVFRGVYTQINPKLFWACNLFPHFLVWSGSSSKEQLVIICGIIVIGFSAKRSFAAGRLTAVNLIFVSVSLWFIYFVRPNYFLIYFTIFATSLFAASFGQTAINRFSVGIWALAFILTILGVTVVASLDAKLVSEEVIDFMKTVQTSFLSYEAGSNRYNIQWNDVSDFMYNSIWGVPQGFIGPTLSEVILKPIQIPAFIEGIVYLCILVYLFFRLVRLAKRYRTLRIHIFPYLFVALIIVFVSYPYLIFNAGSALRYKQAMHPILIFYPLLILAYARAKNLRKL